MCSCASDRVAPAAGLIEWRGRHEEALARARAADRPILLSLACARCRRRCCEERPDALAFYRRAAAVLGGAEHSPAVLFLTPAGHPFHCEGRLERHVVSSVARAFRERPHEVERRAAAVLAVLDLTRTIATPSCAIDERLLRRATHVLLERVEGSIPVPALAFLLQRGQHVAVTHALLGMHDGNRDPCERAQLASLCVRAWAATGDARLRGVAEERIEHVLGQGTAVTAWNGLALATLAEGARRLGDGVLLERARELAALIVGRNATPGGLRRIRGGLGAGQLEDFAAVAHGLLELHAATAEPLWLYRARRLALTAIGRFSDAERGGFYRTAREVNDLPLREKDLVDRPTASGSSLLASVLLRLSGSYGDPDLSHHAEAALRLVVDEADAAPEAFGHALLAMDVLVRRRSGADGDGEPVFASAAGAIYRAVRPRAR